MPTTNGNRKILDMKRWEFCTPAPAAAGVGACIGSSRHFRQQQLYLQSSTSAFLYNPSEDGFVQLPSPALAGSFGAGTGIVASAWSTGSVVGANSLLASGGTTSTLVTNQTLARDLRGYKVHIMTGPNAGETATIAKNTIGANSVITFTTSYPSAFTASNSFRLLTPRWYVINSSTVATGIWRTYDFATNTWTTLTNPSFSSVTTDTKLVTTPSWVGDAYVSFATGTATSATNSTLVNSAKNWTTNQFANYQVRIVAGTGAGQIRRITSNTATTLTVPPWVITPDATSQYSIEGDDDSIYFLGNGAVGIFRYSISGNSWSSITPSVARAGAPNAGLSGHWVYGVSDADWTDENNIQNGRYIFSFRGGGSSALDRYDIALNRWDAITYAPATETFTAGTKYAYNKNFLYIQKESTGRWFRYNFIENSMDGWNTMLYPNGTAVVGDTAFDVSYIDGATEITYIYMILNNSNVMLRQMVV